MAIKSLTNTLALSLDDAFDVLLPDVAGGVDRLALVVAGGGEVGVVTFVLVVAVVAVAPDFLFSKLLKKFAKTPSLDPAVAPGFVVSP